VFGRVTVAPVLAEVTVMVVAIGEVGDAVDQDPGKMGVRMIARVGDMKSHMEGAAGEVGTEKEMMVEV